MQEQVNPVLHAVVSIRHLVDGLNNNWQHMQSAGQSLERITGTTSDVIKSNASEESWLNWKGQLDKYQTDVQALRSIMDSIRQQIQQRKAAGLKQTWETYHSHSDQMPGHFNALETLGRDLIPDRSRADWKSIWAVARKLHGQIEHEAEGASLQLAMIESFDPKEVDELTDMVLKHLPTDYSIEEADQYEAEFVRAYEALKQEASQKKNLWDRFLDLLAGGIHQSPAERVMMQRWINGEKGGL